MKISQISRNKLYNTSFKAQESNKDTASENKNRKIFLYSAAAAIGIAAIAGYMIWKGKNSKAQETLMQTGGNLQPGKDRISTKGQSTADSLLAQREKAQLLKTDSAYTIIVPHKTESVEADVLNFQKLREHAPKEAPGGKDKINSAFTGFQIKPHNYADDTDVLILARDNVCDFYSYKLEDSRMTRLNVSGLDEIVNGRYKPAGYFFNTSPDKRCLQAGTFEDGRPFVSFIYALGETVDGGRKNYETVMLVSRNSGFTQAQKDIIKAFAANQGKRFENDIPPMIEARLMPAFTSKNETSHRMQINKNVLLSAISSWAENSPEFNIEKFLQEHGSEFRIGI